MMVNPFAYEEYRREKIRQKIEETRAQRVQLKVKKKLGSFRIGLSKRENERESPRYKQYIWRVVNT